MRPIHFLTSLLLISATAAAQYDHIPVLASLEGDALRIALIDNYKPSSVLDLSDARDTLYARIHLHADSVRCVYTGRSKYLDLDEDPSQFLFGAGGDTDINLEHGYPQGKGAGFGNAQSDMHHLFPTRVDVNQARGSDPLATIPDNQTREWYYDTRTLSSTPQTKIDAYSEDTNLNFEPREDFKGNMARAYFYFYTMYQNQADAEDPLFFEAQRETLCDWHDLDPVDSLEWARTFLIATHQDEKANPFILDCRLARLYCGEVSAGCRTVGLDDLDEKSSLLSPNPSMAGQPINVQSINPTTQISIYKPSGRLYDIATAGTLSAPTIPGVYLLRWTDKLRTTSAKLVVVR